MISLCWRGKPGVISSDPNNELHLKNIIERTVLYGMEQNCWHTSAKTELKLNPISDKKWCRFAKIFEVVFSKIFAQGIYQKIPPISDFWH